jgi:hypothetical protein
LILATSVMFLPALMMECAKFGIDCFAFFSVLTSLFLSKQATLGLFWTFSDSLNDINRQVIS